MATELESRACESEGEVEEDLDDGVSQPLDEAPPQQEDATPHPARRPMNAFLIFCKRHRAQVREKYPHLENRQVTKILGEWWADLPAHQKTSYTDLARQYKEAFLRANPDFKWYKIPAQPPRPPPARPSNQKVPRCDPLPTDGAITFGKLADEAQMGGLSTLLSTASNSNNSSNSFGTLNFGSFSPVYISPASSLTDITTLAPVSCANSVTLSSVNTNTNISGTNLLSWSESLKRPGGIPALSSSSSPRAITNTSEEVSGSIIAIPITVTPPLVDSGTTMTPPKPPKKRYLHENPLMAQSSSVSVPAYFPPETAKKKACSALLELSQTSHTEEKLESSPNWSVRNRRHRNEVGIQMSHQNTSEQDIGTPSGALVTGVNPPMTIGHHSSRVISPPHASLSTPVVFSTLSHQSNHSSNRHRSVQCDEQPLNLTTETTICASQQQLINNIVEHMVNGPTSVMRSNRSHLNFFHPENLNNNNNNETEKSPLHKAIDARINGNGNCDVSLFLSKTLDLVIGRALDNDKSPRKEKILSKSCKDLFAEASKNQCSSADVDKNMVPQPKQGGEEKKDAVSSSNNISNGIANPNMRPRKRPKVDLLEESGVFMKKRKEVTSEHNSQGNSRGGLAAVGGRRSRAPRKCKGKRYEELISEGVLQAPRRSRARNIRWEGAESNRNQENEETVDDSNQQDGEDEENYAESPIEEVSSQVKVFEDENSETGRSRTEEGRRRGQRQLRRLRPDDFDLEARIEALPSLSLDEFTRRKKERKRTSSSSSSTTTSNSSTFATLNHNAESSVGMSCNSRVSAPADSTSGAMKSSTVSIQVIESVISSSNSHTNGIRGSDGENVSTTPSSPTSSAPSIWFNPSLQAPIFVQGGSLSPGETAGLSSSEGGPLIGSQKRKARKQTITRHDPVHGPLRRDTSVVEQSVLTSITLADLAEVALSQPSMEI